MEWEKEVLEAFRKAYFRKFSNYIQSRVALRWFSTRRQMSRDVTCYCEN